METAGKATNKRLSNYYNIQNLNIRKMTQTGLGGIDLIKREEGEREKEKVERRNQKYKFFFIRFNIYIYIFK